jgi:branched-chain amino acid transport system permease protein
MIHWFKGFFAWLRTAAGVSVSAAVLLAAFAAIDRGPYVLVNTVVMGGMLGLVAMGLAIILGVLNIPSFVHGEFFMIGGLAAYYVITPIKDYLFENPSPFLAVVGPVLAIGAATLAGALAGALAELLVFRELRRRNRDNWVMNCFLLTVGLNVILINGHQLLFGADFKGIVSYWEGRPIELFDVAVSMDRLLAFLISVSIVVGFWLFMKYTRTGRAIRAVAQDETGATMVGIPLGWIMTLTMALGCGLAAVAGGSLLFMYPSYPTVGMEATYMAWFVVILVGLGRVLGALVGGFMVALLKIVTLEYVGSGWDFVVPSALIILVLIFKPSGIFGSEVRGVLDQ